MPNHTFENIYISIKTNMRDPKPLPIDKLYLYTDSDPSPLLPEEEEQLRKLESTYLDNHDLEMQKLAATLVRIEDDLDRDMAELAPPEKVEKKKKMGILGRLFGSREEGDDDTRMEGGFEVDADEQFEDLGDVSRAQEVNSGASSSRAMGHEEDAGGSGTGYEEEAGGSGTGYDEDAAGSGSGNEQSDEEEDQYVLQQRENRRLMEERQARDQAARENNAGDETPDSGEGQVKQKIVGKKKGKSLARKEQRKAYHEYQRTVGEARKREEEEWQEEYKEVLRAQKYTRDRNEARAAAELSMDRLYESFVAELDHVSFGIYVGHVESRLQTSEHGFVRLENGQQRNAAHVSDLPNAVTTADDRFWVTLDPTERETITEMIRDQGTASLEDIARVIEDMKKDHS